MAANTVGVILLAPSGGAPQIFRNGRGQNFRNHQAGIVTASAATLPYRRADPLGDEQAAAGVLLAIDFSC
jgi:hypothetical protein